jgi:hypothetical protein
VCQSLAHFISDICGQAISTIKMEISI